MSDPENTKIKPGSASQNASEEVEDSKKQEINTTQKPGKKSIVGDEGIYFLDKYEHIIKASEKG